MKKIVLILAAAAAITGVTTSCGSDKSQATDSIVSEGSDAISEAEMTSGVDVPEDENMKASTPMEIKVDTTGYTTTASGLKYKVIKEGTGKKPASAEAIVEVHYTGKHMNGETFDSSYDRNETIEFPLNQVIAGWTEGLQLMKEGAKYQFIIPSELAYGSDVRPGSPIGPNEDLYFEVELFKTK